MGDLDELNEIIDVWRGIQRYLVILQLSARYDSTSGTNREFAFHTQRLYKFLLKRDPKLIENEEDWKRFDGIIFKLVDLGLVISSWEPNLYWIHPNHQRDFTSMGYKETVDKLTRLYNMQQERTRR